MAEGLTRFFKFFERVIVISLSLMMIVVVLSATIELGRILLLDIITPPNLLLDINEMLDVFGFFLLILIGVELLETIRAYLNDHVVHVEIVLEVALIAVARKIIILDVKTVSAELLLAIAALVLALAGAFFLQLRARSWRQAKNPPETATPKSL
jgi:uncharacterized membrane protein (DUF373 family)